MNREDFILKKKYAHTFLDKLLAFPLWVKQIVFLRLYQNLSLSLSEDFITTEESEISTYMCLLCHLWGVQSCLKKKSGLDDNMYNFLKNVDESLACWNRNEQFWTMEEVAKYFISCLDLNFVKTPESVHVFAMRGFMAGKF